MSSAKINQIIERKICDSTAWKIPHALNVRIRELFATVVLCKFVLFIVSNIVKFLQTC